MNECMIRPHECEVLANLYIVSIDEGTRRRRVVVLTPSGLGCDV